jgi:hypothetical protein
LNIGLGIYNGHQIIIPELLAAGYVPFCVCSQSISPACPSKTLHKQRPTSNPRLPPSTILEIPLSECKQVYETPKASQKSFRIYSYTPANKGYLQPAEG